GQGRVLVHLREHDNVPQWRIARAMKTSPAAITSILKRMERDGWITRTRDPNDQRTVRIRMSDKARALEEEIQGTFVQIEEEISSIYTQEERAELRRLLLKLNERFSEDDESSAGSTIDNDGKKS
ncbi:MAG TPA: MarR family transcriptional regulator, partial [Candidatus Acetothermia bacterium]|nr:MarR family transcriptional regulator [Candidatus Acetothermia bacterium]